MSIRFISGDILQADAQTVAFGYNAKGKAETGELEMRLLQAFPVPFATFQRRARQGQQKTGSLYLWTEQPRNVLFMVVRESSVGVTRLRYVQAVAMTLARDYRLYGITSLAIAPLGSLYERDEINMILQTWFSLSELAVTAYTE